MKIIEIVALNNGAHRNQNSIYASVPEGWAVIPEAMETPNFPFGNITTEEIDGVMTVTKWEAIEAPADIITPSEIERLRADVDYIAIMTGVEL